MADIDYYFLKEELKEIEPDFLEPARIINKCQSYVCPSCGNGSGKTRTGMVQNPKTLRWHCFSCGGDYDIYDLAMLANDIKDFDEAYKWVAEYAGVDSSGAFERRRARNKIPLRYREYEESNDYSDYILSVKNNNKFEYLLARGISATTQLRFNIGYDENWRHPKVSEDIPTSPRCIIPTSRYSYLARDTRPEDSLTEKEKKYMKSKVGSVHIFNIAAFDEARDYIFITEGEIDAMSIEDVGFLAVGLGSVSNVERLLDIWNEEEWYIDTVLLFCDNDNKGKECSELLKNELERRGLCNKAYEVEYPANSMFKDPNQFLMANRKWFQAFLQNIVNSECRKYSVHFTEFIEGYLNRIMEKYDMNRNDVVKHLIMSEAYRIEEYLKKEKRSSVEPDEEPLFQ